MDSFRKTVEELLQKHKLDSSLLEIPPDPSMGDFAYPCFSLAKELKKAPNLIAKDLAAKYAVTGIITKIEAKGPYINFFLDKTKVAEIMLQAIFKEKSNYGKYAPTNKKILIEYPGPNTNKPLHLGHARNMVLGTALTNLLRAAGHQVTVVNINNNRGVHICKSMLAYQKWGKGDTPEKSNLKPDHFVGKYYILFSQKAEQQPELEQEAQTMLKKWEEHDPEIVALWKKMNKWAYTGFAETYKIFGVQIEKEYYESDTYAQGKEIVLQGLQDGLFQKNEKGSIVIDLTKEGYGKKVLLRSDGTTVYITQDLYLGKKRWEDYHFDQIIHIVGKEQKYHFEILFKIYEKLKLPFFDKCYHLAYGLINLVSGKMSSREGTVINCDTLVKEVQQLAKEAVKERCTTLTEEEITKRSHAVALSAIKFFLLRQDVYLDITFDPKASIAFEGETGPYVQYTYARCSSILRKAGKAIKPNVEYNKLDNSQEKQIIILLARYGEVIKQAAEQYKPNYIARYTLELAQTFNEFYHAHQVISEDESLTKARLFLVFCVKEVLANSLQLLGIEPLEAM